MILKIVFVSLILFLFCGKAFALFPTEEMLNDPLFDSLFVLHNDEERRVDDSLYEVYRSNYRHLQRNGVFPDGIRKVIELDDSGINVYNKLYKNEILVNRKNGKMIPRAGIHDPSGLNKYIKDYLNHKKLMYGLKSDTAVYEKIVKSKKYSATMPYYTIVNAVEEINGNGVCVMQPITKEINDAGLAYMHILNEKYSQGLGFSNQKFIITGVGLYELDFTLFYDDSNIKAIHTSGVLRLNEDYSFRSITYQGNISNSVNFDLDIISKSSSNVKLKLSKTLKKYLNSKKVNIVIGNSFYPSMHVIRNSAYYDKKKVLTKRPYYVGVVIIQEHGSIKPIEIMYRDDQNDGNSESLLEIDNYDESYSFYGAKLNYPLFYYYFKLK